jgi:hypothetical protein
MFIAPTTKDSMIAYPFVSFINVKKIELKLDLQSIVVNKSSLFLKYFIYRFRHTGCYMLANRAGIFHQAPENGLKTWILIKYYKQCILV